MIRFENYLRLHGPKAFVVYKAVFSIPFNDPRGEYAPTREVIENAARRFGIRLHRLQEEHVFISGEARKAKSPKTRRLYRQLVRRASQEMRVRAMHTSTPAPTPTRMPIPIPLLGNVALTMDADFEQSEYLVNVEEQLSPLIHGPRKMTTETCQPTLAFRVWDSNSRAKFSSQHGFVSEVFQMWKGPFPEPFQPDGAGKQALTILMNIHLSMKGGSSAFVSTTSSLLQAFTKASSMSKPHIAVILLDHPTLTKPHRTIHAAESLKDLKEQGQAWWARYKGITEYMIWANIPSECICTHFPLADLISLYEEDQTVANILHLQEFTAGRKTMALSAALREKNITLTPSTAAAMGRVAKLFGLDRAGVALYHIETFIARLVDGWSIIDNASGHINDISCVFAEALKSRAYRRQEIIGAYLAGIKEGTETLAFFERRRRPAKR
jgi:hypothetical protein